MDDNPANLAALTAALEGMDIVIVTAASGREALQRLLDQDFAVALLDVNMPVMDGFETATMIRSRQNSEHLPIIFITAERFNDDERLKGYELGAVDYIMSPVLPQILRSKVEVFTDLYRLRAQSECDREEIARQNLMLIEASRAKSEFLANMSHELRTPLTSIIGFSEALKDGLMGKLAGNQLEYIECIYTSGEYLLSLINDILDLAKIESCRMTLDLEDFSPDSLLHGSLSMVGEKAMARSLRLSLDVDEGMPHIVADMRRLKQIIYNLLSNAVKFTPDGGTVTLHAHRVEGTLEIAVTDNGIGIRREDQARLFQPFVQIDSSLARNDQGYGLGLVMVKHLAELHGGSAGLESEPGKGSRFWVRIPWRT